MKRILVIYHREDNDGACSAGIVDAFHKKFMLEGNYSVKFKGVNYADLSRYWKEYETASENMQGYPKPKMLDWIGYDEVYMLDISFNEPAAMEFMFEQLKEHFVWCDHHKPIIELSKEWRFGSANGIRRTDQSALMNTWYFLCEEFDLPDAKASNEMIKLSDYDSWAWTRKTEYDNDQARENLFDLNVGITHRSNLNPKWFSDWIFNWLDSEFSYRNAAGEVHYHTACEAQIFGHQARELDKKRTDRAVASNGDCTWRLRNGESVCVLFTTERMNSMSFGAVTDKSVRYGAVIKYDAKNDNWTLGLYNFSDDDKFDCGEYLKQWYNGGGHPGAAGCTLTAAHVSGMIMSKQV